ncbi:hypothetical protein ACG3SL_08295 [Sphingomonas sp. CJ20]
MTYVASLHMAEQIAAIEARGVGQLRSAQRRRSFAFALRWALPATLPVPALAFCAGWVAPLRWGVVGVGAVAVPSIVFGIAYLRCWGRERPEREAALALFDHGFHLKDRIRATDEFLRDSNGDAFKAAALLEAEPWIRGVADRSPEVTPTQAAPGRRWLFVVGAAALLVASALQPALRPVRPTPGPLATALAAIGITANRQAANATNGDPRQPVAPSAGSAAAAGQPDRAAQAQAAANGETARQSDGAGKSLAALGQASAADGFDRPGSHAGASMAAAPSGNARQAQQGAKDATTQSAQRDSGAGGSTEQRSVASDAQRDPSAGGAQAQRSGQAPPNNPANGSQPPSSSPLGSQQRPQQGQGSNGSRQNQQSRSQQGSQDQSQPGQGKGQGRDGQRTGQDALKRSNGVAALLLAVPMADRLGGTANPGLVSSLPQPVPPHAGAASAANAGDRGRATGTIGRVSHPAASPQERGVLRDYFRRGGGTAREGSVP